MSPARARLRVGACLSLSGQFARFGTQAAHALHTWTEWHGNVDLIIEDDRSTQHGLETTLPDVAARSDLLLGPYSTMLARRAAQLAAQEDWLVWNHGGSGDDIETDYPGHVVSILTPTSRYAYPYLDYLATLDSPDDIPLWIVAGPGSFARHITDGTRTYAAQQEIPVKVVTAEQFRDRDTTPPDGSWALLAVGRFEDDIDTVRHAHTLTGQPVAVCAVAAGVYEFAEHIDDPNGFFGIAQWFPGNTGQPELGPNETEFLRAYAATSGTTPDYPAIQAVAGAVIAHHCTTHTGTNRAALWAAATELDTSTLFGGFGIDSTTGAQDCHATALVRWQDDQPHRHE